MTTFRPFATVLIAASTLVTGLALPGPAGAKVIRGSHQIISDVPHRVGPHVENIPMEITKPLKVVTLRGGRDRYRGIWNNFIFGGNTTAFHLKIQRREIRDGGGQRTLIFADERLTATDLRDFKVLVDIGRDADVLVVADGHPACAGLTTAQARQIASGAVTRWSQVVAIPPGQPDTIALRHSQYQARYFQSRFGVAKLPPGAKAKSDGGGSEVAAGDRAVAAFTSWSYIRRSAPGCAVPLDGIAPSNATVHALTYPGAHPLTLVAHRERQAIAHDRVARKAFVAYIKSAATRQKFKRNGLLLASEPPPADAPASGPGSGGSQPSSGGPSQDRQGRPITPIRDDAFVRSALTGERLKRPPGSGLDEHFAFEPDRVLRELRRAPDGSNCTQAAGTWDVEAGWRYDEHGGGIIARVKMALQTTRTSTVELPNDTPGTGYIDGVAYARSRDLPGSCG